MLCNFPKKNHFLLVIPLTRAGTGKTYASAFAMRELNYKKVLFLVHRNQIAKQAEKSFRKVFGNSVTMGIITGTLGRADYHKDYIFATIQTLCKDDTLQRFEKDYFDVIIYDEAHHITAD
jgi:superfamily II DNA or RNA helicase